MASNDLTEAAAVTEATICNLAQFDCSDHFSQATRRTDVLMSDIKQRGLTIVDSSNMPEVEKAVKSYVSLVCKNLWSHIDGKAMQLFEDYSLFRLSNESVN